MTVPAVLFVHGANTSGAGWIALAAHVSGFRRGLAQPLTPATLPAFADTLLIDVLDALELPSSHLVATSFGGYIALRTAATHPERVDRMVQFSWPVGAPTTWVPTSMRILAIPGVHRLMAALPATERSVRSTFRRIGHGPSLQDGRITREDIECYLALLRETDTLRNELAFARAFVSPLHGLRDIVLTDELLAAIDAPSHRMRIAVPARAGPAVGRDMGLDRPLRQVTPGRRPPDRMVGRPAEAVGEAGPADLELLHGTQMR